MSPQSVDRKEFLREQNIRDTQIPFRAWTYVDAVFAAADTDVDIPHPFTMADPETIRYIPVAVDGSAYIYRQSGGTRTAWQSTHIYLRASGICTARLLLMVERPL